jgi:Transcriptional regulator, AbiEi antitoxin
VPDRPREPLPNSGRVSGHIDRKPSQSAVDRAIARVATRQSGVISIEQLRALGLTYEAVRARVRRGRLIPIHRGVYAVGHTSLVPRAYLIAAVLACGPDSFLSHRTAAAVWGLREVVTRSVEVTVPSNRTGRTKGLVIHRTTSSRDRSEVRVRGGLRVSSVPRLLIELASREKPAELDRLITQAVRKQVLEVEAVERAIAKHCRRPGVAKLATAFEDYRPKPDRKSGLERDFDALIAGTDIPEPLRNIFIDGWEIDCYWPDANFAVELDGRPYHIAVRDQDKDKYKDAKLMVAGITVMRITDTRFELDRQGVLDDVRAMTLQQDAA